MISKPNNKKNTVLTRKSSVKKGKKNTNLDNSIEKINSKGLGLEHVGKVNDDTLNLENNLQDFSQRGKRQANQVLSLYELNEKRCKKIKQCEDDFKLVKQTIADLDRPSSDSEGCDESNSSVFASKNEFQLEPKKRSKKKKKKNKSNPTVIGSGSEPSLTWLQYLSEWKNNNDSWKFEKLKQIRLISNVFDREKVGLTDVLLLASNCKNEV